MKKQILTAAAALIATGAFAQEVVEEAIVDQVPTAYTALNSSFKSNWFVSVGAGANMFFGDHDRKVPLAQRIAPNFDIAVGKWFTPTIGVRMMFSGLMSKGATQIYGTPGSDDFNSTARATHSTGKPVNGHDGWGEYLYHSRYNWFTLHADVMFDVTSMILGYNPNRIYSCAPYIGVGWGRVCESPNADAVIGNLGVMNIFHVSKAIDVNLDVRGTVMHDGFDGIQGRRAFEGDLSLTAGITYRFNPRGWNSRTIIVTEYDNEAVNQLRAQVNDLVSQNEKLEKDLAGKTVEHKTVKQIAGGYLIYFPINVSALSNADKAQLEMVAKMIKEAGKNAKFSVIGYADKATGTPEINERLSRERAEAVRDYLVNDFGVSANSLDVTWRGGVENMYFNDPALSRVVIITGK